MWITAFWVIPDWSMDGSRRTEKLRVRSEKKMRQEMKTHAGGSVARRSVQEAVLRQTDVAVRGMG